MSSASNSPRLHSLPLLGSGKVRDNYAVGDDRLLMVTSDRLSAFDVIMAEPIPDKGRVLNTLALFWFDRLKHVVPNHLTGEAPESVVQPDEVPLGAGRSMLVRRLQGVSGPRQRLRHCAAAGHCAGRAARCPHLHAGCQGRSGPARREHFV